MKYTKKRYRSEYKSEYKNGYKNIPKTDTRKDMYTNKRQHWPFHEK